MRACDLVSCEVLGLGMMGGLGRNVRPFKTLYKKQCFRTVRHLMSSHALTHLSILQATNAGVRRPGYEATLQLCYS